MAPIVRFMHIESSSGLLLVACTVLALALANSPLAGAVAAFWRLPCEIKVGGWSLRKDLLHVVNDGLMTIFFFIVGLEIKREMVHGELRELRKAALPIIAAIGGMAAPALVYFVLWRFLGLGPAAERGWAIPMATDIAFVVGILALFGARVPFGLKLLLLTLAIVDDLGAVLVIALVFSDRLELAALGLGLLGVAATGLMNWIGVRRVGAYVVVGALVWLAVLKAGIHPTVAGVLLGLMTPTNPWVPTNVLLRVWDGLLDRLGQEEESEEERHEAWRRARFALRESISPLDRLEAALHPWVAYGIMPLFALANAGVTIRPEALFEPVALAIAAGLTVGKPLGILLTCWGAVRLGAAQLPAGVTPASLAGGACLAGIGFTMSLFLVGLALPDSLIDAGKIGTLAGSAVSTLLGAAILWRLPPAR